MISTHPIFASRKEGGKKKNPLSAKGEERVAHEMPRGESAAMLISYQNIEYKATSIPPISTTPTAKLFDVLNMLASTSRP